MAAREQLRELKLNVTNIKSVLVKGKEEEKRIKSKRVAFVRKDTQREKRIEKEKSVSKMIDRRYMGCIIAFKEFRNKEVFIVEIK